MEIKRLFIIGIAISPPGTMGGNTKIVLEYARHLPAVCETVFIVPSDKRETYDAVSRDSLARVIEIKGFGPLDMRRPVASARHYLVELQRVFAELAVGPGDVVLACSDLHIETYPLFVLQKRLGFTWVPSMFLFVPGPFENLSRRYGFPFVKYAAYYLYQRLMFSLQKARGSAFVITNHSDCSRFPSRFRNRLYAAYGGVNVEQIPSDANRPETLYDAVFCSRLHPQKGIGRLLDIWRLVLDQKPDARLAVIGNGSPTYEASLRDKAAHLGLEPSITWFGYVNGEAKYRIYRQSRLLAHATVYDNNGMVAAEALCTGLPVVMNDIPALRSLYTTGCVKVPYGDNAAFAAAILAPAPVLSAADRANLREKWDWPRRAGEFYSFLKDCEGV